MDKLINKNQIKDHLFDGMSIMIGGFMCVGTPNLIIDAILESNIKDLTLICNDGGLSDDGIGKLIANNQCKKLIASHIGLNQIAQEKMKNKEIIVELVPQGTLIEQIRAGGSGLGGVLTRTGLGTLVEENKQKVEVDNKVYLLEKPMVADLAIIKANYASSNGNLKLLGTTINFNKYMAMAATTCIAQYDELLPRLDPNEVNVIGVLVDYLVKE